MDCTWVLVLLSSAAAACFPAGAHGARSRPNIVIVMVDDLGWSDVGYSNISAVKTPVIDRLAAEGVKLMSYYTQAMCTPSRGALMTGMYPIHIGMQHFVINSTSPWGMPRNLPTLPQKLRELGYSTYLVGKWHLGYFDWDYVPTARGYDSFFGIYMGEGDHWNHTKLGYLDMRRGKEPTWRYTGQYSTDVFTEEAMNIVTRHNPKQPLFLFLSYTAPHTPLQAHPQDIHKYKNISDVNRRTFLAMVDAVDQGTGRLVDACKTKGIWNDTIFIWLSDNGGFPGPGGGYNWPLRGMKSNLWEGGVRVPAFVRGSMLKKRGVQVNDLVHVTDWYPTLIKLAGGTVEENIDGVDQWTVISEGQSSKRTEILHNIDYAPDLKAMQYAPLGFSYYTGAALRIGHMKLLHRSPNSTWYELPENGAAPPTAQTLPNDRLPFVDVALYNITADPEERHDLKAKYPDIVKKMLARLKEFNATVVKYLLKPEDPECLRLARKLQRWEPWMDEDSITSSTRACATSNFAVTRHWSKAGFATNWIIWISLLWILLG